MTGLYLQLARRYLLGKKGRSFMTLLGIALGVTMVVAVLLTNSAIISSYEGLLSATAGRADLQITATTGAGFPQSILNELKGRADLLAAVPAINSAAPVASGDRKSGATFYGIDPEKDRQVRDYKLSGGRLPGSAGAEREVAVSADLARNLDLAPGSSLKLLTTTGMQEFTVVGVFDSAGTVRGALGPFGVMPLGAAQAAFGREGKLDVIDLIVSPGHTADQVRESLASELGGRARVGTPAERTKDMQRMLDSVIFVLTLAGAISMFAGSFIIYTNVSMGVAERRRDLSILRALGMKKGEVVWLVLSEASLLGLLGAALGIVWGYGMARATAQQMANQFLKGFGVEIATVTVTPAVALTALAVGIVTSVAAALIPARDTLRYDPVEAMRPGEAGRSRERNTWVQGALGLLLAAGGAAVIVLSWPDRGEGMLSQAMLRVWGLMMGVMVMGMVIVLPVLLLGLNRWIIRPLLILIFGITGRLASDNLVRQPRRTAATIAALMVSLIFMVGMGGTKTSQIATFDRWYEKVVGWDMNISTSFVGISAQVEMDPGFVRELAKVEGVRLVSPQKMGRVLLSDGEQGMMYAFDTRLLRQYSELNLESGDPNQVAEQMELGGKVLITPAVARRLNIGVGDKMNLSTPSGEQRFEVAAIMLDSAMTAGAIQLDRNDYVRYFKDETSSNVSVLVEKGADPAVVRERIMGRWGESMNLTVRLNREFWREIRNYYESFYALLDGLIWISVSISGLAIANTLMATVLERKREFGILRAIGTRRGEIIRVLVGEAIGTGLVGGVLGLAVGLAWQWVMVHSSEFINGTYADMVMNWNAMAMAMAVAVVAAPLVGLLPGRWAARLDVVESLRYE